MKLTELFAQINPCERRLYRPYIIAEAGVNHEGSMAIAKRLDSPQGKILSLLVENLKQPHPRGDEVPASAPDKEDTPMTGLAEDKMRLTVLISNLSAYIEQFHGGFVELVDYDGKIVTVRMGGACAVCDLKPSTLHGWVEGTIRQFFPDIEAVEAVD
jgi:Fe-S cluster biogenesis protein NfuA